MNTLIQRLTPIKKDIENKLNIQLDWYASDDDYVHVDNNHGVINYQLTTHLADSTPHFMEISIAVTLVNLDKFNWQMYKLGFSQTDQIQFDNELSPVSQWQKVVTVV